MTLFHVKQDWEPVFHVKQAARGGSLSFHVKHFDRFPSFSFRTKAIEDAHADDI